MYEHCFEQLLAEEKKVIRPPITPLVGFSRQVSWPLGLVTLAISLYDYRGHTSKMVMVEFKIVRAPSPYNIIPRRSGLRQLGAVASTLHAMMKFQTQAGVAIIKGERLQSSICNHISQKRDQTKKSDGIEDVEHVTSADMIGIPRELAKHRLNIHLRTFLVWQKKRAMAKEQSEAIMTEVSKLVDVRILKAVYFPKWVSNPVMVKKTDGTWRMCIDFTSLNKACPKDSYPLPEMDQKIESLEGFKLKCFLDAYKGYHQIRMVREDEEKTSFHIEQGTFCYKKMPFRLKNAGATYQRLMDNMFAGQLGRNIEIYVHDMAIELGEHEILYKPRSTVKGQILADFLAESPTVNNSPVPKVTNTSEKYTLPARILFTDGASSIEGSCVGLILTHPSGQEITYALRFDFRTSNNEAEYEALVARLELAIHMEVK
nr:reverse transcriptase domain-containing protein [Tanacetum cinerariifolium]